MFRPCQSTKTDRVMVCNIMLRWVEMKWELEKLTCFLQTDLKVILSFTFSRIPKLCLLSNHSLTLLHCTDVYSGVVELVVRRINEDAANGDPVAKMLIGKVDRKVIKQTVMTSVYGVTFIGARKQIHNALKDKAQLSEEQFFPASMYLSKATFASIKEMFTGAREIMEWLG